MLSTEYLVMFATFPTSGNLCCKLDQELKNAEKNYTLPTFTHRSATHCSGTPRHEPSLIEQHIAQEHHDMNLHSSSNTLLRNATIWTFTHRAAHCSGTPRHEPSLIEQHIAQECHDMILHSSSNTLLRNATTWTFTHRATHCSGMPRHEPSLIEQHIAHEHHTWHELEQCFNTKLTSIKMAYTLHVIHSPPPQFQQFYHIANIIYNNNFIHN